MCNYSLVYLDSLEYLKSDNKKYQLIYLDPPYNTKRNRGSRKSYKDNSSNWSEWMLEVIKSAYNQLLDEGFMAFSINQTELFNLKNLADQVFKSECFIGLFPVKIRHKDRQLMINATFHDVYEYMLIYRKSKSTRFYCKKQVTDLDKFSYEIVLHKCLDKREISGKTVEIYEPGGYDIIKYTQSELDSMEDRSGLLRRYIIAGKLKTANWSGEWYENHLSGLGKDLLCKVYGLENDGLGYRYFHTYTDKRSSGVYFQSQLSSGRLILPTNDLDYTESVTQIYKEGGLGCDFKDSKKPEELMKWLLDICTQENDYVLDVFAGSGTMLASCIKSNRSCVSIDNNIDSISIVKNRLENISSGKDIDDKVYQFCVLYQ